MSDKQVTKEWELYREGLAYNQKISLVPTVDKCERMYSGDQWHGVVSNDLPTPVLNVLKRVINYKISQIMSNALKMQFSMNPRYTPPQDPPMQQDVAMLMQQEQKAKLEEKNKMFNQIAAAKWEKLKMDSLLEKILKDAAISGDGCMVFPFDNDIECANGVMGDFTAEIVDNVNIMYGNPNDNRINSCGRPIQPHIIIAFREMVEDLREEARGNNVPEEEVMSIMGDNESQDQSGDMAKIELDDAKKCIALLFLRYDRKTKTIIAKKTTKYATVRPEKDTKRKLYPVALMNWEERKNCFHGESEAKALIPNQLAINKLCAMLILSVMHNAFPRMVYNSHFIDKNHVNNRIGAAIPVSGGNGNISEMLKYIQPGQSSPEAYNLLDKLITLTKEMMGASEVGLGEVQPDNTSAFIAVSQASAAPLKTVQNRLYQFVEDIAYIWLDYWLTDYNTMRQVDLKDGEEYSTQQVNLSEYNEMMFSAKVDVGASNQWSEVVSIQTLDALLDKHQITFSQYLKRIPKGIIPMKSELLDEIEALEQQQQQMQEQQMQMQGEQQETIILDKYMKMLPPELQQAVADAIQQGMQAA